MESKKRVYLQKPIEFQTYTLLAYASIYILIALITYAVPMREISIFGIHTYGSALILPAWYVLGDAIAELFGIKISRFLVWMSIISCIIYALVVKGILQLPYPATWQHESNFDYVFSPLMRGIVVCNIATLIGGYINSYLVTRWKILIKGRYFFLRSLGASVTGEFIHVLMATFALYYSTISFKNILLIAGTTYLLHVVLSLIYQIPNTWIVFFLKKRIELTSLTGNPFKEYL